MVARAAERHIGTVTELGFGQLPTQRYDRTTSVFADIGEPRVGSPIPIIDKAHVAPLPDHDMVEDTHPHQLTDLTQAARDFNILLARRRVAARMIVDEDDGGGRFADHRSEDVTRVHDARRQRPL